MLILWFIKASVCPVGKKKIDFFDTDCKGLMLEVRISGGKTFSLRYQDERGKTHQIRLADAEDVTLTQARTLADKRRTQIAMGEDPLERKAVLRSVPLFADFIADRYMPFVKVSKKSWASDSCYLRNHIIPALGKKHLDAITKHDVIALHHGMRSKGYAFGTANRILILLRYAMNLAVRWEIAGVTKNPTKDVALFIDPNFHVAGRRPG